MRVFRIKNYFFSGNPPVPKTTAQSQRVVFVKQLERNGIPGVQPTTSDYLLRLYHNQNTTHAGDTVPVQIFAGNDIDNVLINLPKAAEITAGRDIRNLFFTGQNASAQDTTWTFMGFRPTLIWPYPEGTRDAVHSQHGEPHSVETGPFLSTLRQKRSSIVGPFGRQGCLNSGSITAGRLMPEPSAGPDSAELVDHPNGHQQNSVERRRSPATARHAAAELASRHAQAPRGLWNRDARRSRAQML